MSKELEYWLMETASITPFQHALDVVEQLPPGDQEALIEVIRRRLIEQRREEIAANAEATRKAIREGKAKYGTVDDLRRWYRNHVVTK